MKTLVTDELWEVIEPLLPTQRRSRKGGRPPVPNRAALTGILFVLQTGIPWEYLPQEMGCGTEPVNEFETPGGLGLLTHVL